MEQNNMNMKEYGQSVEGFIITADNERMIENKIEIDVLGYLISAGKNEKRPRISIKENAVQVRLPRERTIAGDEHIDKDDGRFYRE